MTQGLTGGYQRALREGRNPSKKDRQNSNKWQRLYQKENRERIRLEVLSAYSNGKKWCVRCHIKDLRVLSIDHIDGSGAKHRKQLFGNSHTAGHFYKWLRSKGFPKGYQVLCMNCQWIKRRNNKEIGRGGAP